MPTERLDCTNILAVAGSMTVQGADPWGDASTSTYVDLGAPPFTPEVVTVSYDIDALSVDPSWVTDVTFHIQLTGQHEPVLFSIHDGTKPSGPSLASASVTYMGGFADTFNGPMALDGGVTIADLAEALAAGTWGLLGTQFRVVADTVYTFYYEVTYTPATTAPPLRHTQRDDLRNTGTASRQRSLRNTGYL